MRLGHRVSEKNAERVRTALSGHLMTGEEILLVVQGGPGVMDDHCAVTTGRIIGIQSLEKKQIWITDVQKATFPSLQITKHMALSLRDGSKRSVVLPCRHRDSERKLILQTISGAMASDSSAKVREAYRIENLPAELAAEEKARVDNREWPDSIVIGGRLGKAMSRATHRQCAPDESPWLILVSPMAGSLVAFEDRLAIIKAGNVTSFMAGSLGGERSTVFYYTDITGIEYNSGILNGVLEVLTASYSGTANRDYWQGVLSSPNTDANSPFAVSNTLPLLKPEYNEALPHIKELRRRISNYKGSRHGTAAPPPPTASNLGTNVAEGLEKLAALHANGVLSDEEFLLAKRRLLGTP